MDTYYIVICIFIYNIHMVISYILYICYTAIHVYILYIYTCIDTLYIDISYISYISPKSISLEILHPDCQWVLVRPLDVWPHPSPG